MKIKKTNLKISKLEKGLIGTAIISGVSGLMLPMFDEPPRYELYDYMLAAGSVFFTSVMGFLASHEFRSSRAWEDRTTIDSALDAYKPEFRYLQEAELKFPEIKGKFSIPKSGYIQDTGHLNAAELLICYNQLAYTFIAEAGRRELIPELGALSERKFKEYQLNNMLIFGINNARFRKPIKPRDFEGKIVLDKTRRNGKNLFFRTNYDFGQGSFTGEVDLALVR